MTKQSLTARPAPGPSGYPLLGVLPKVWGDPLQFFLNAAIEYGDVVRLEMGPRTLYLVSGPDSVQWVLQDNNRNYRKGYDQAKPLLGEGLVTSEGEFWLQQRRRMQPLFNRRQIDAYIPVMLQAADEMLSRWDEAARQGQPLDVADEMMRLTQTIILRTMFSTDIGQRSDEVAHAFDLALEHLNQILFTQVEWLTRLPTPGNLRHQRALRYLDDYVYGLIHSRRASGVDTGDLLSHLLQARDPETGEPMSDRQVRDEVITIFLAGHETTANALAWTWYLLAQHPQAAARLEAEVDETLGNRLPDAGDLANLPYTGQVFQEALRLYPPAWMFARHAVNDDEVGGCHIPAGQMLMISPYVTHRLPGVWEQPDAFDPERFSPERSRERPRYAYFPFGGGPRLCIGNNFALVEAGLIMARVVQHYRLHLAPGCEVEPRPIATLQPRPGVLMNLVPR